MPKKTFFNLSAKAQAEIIETAIDVYTQEKFENITIRTLSERLNISIGSFYDYFYDKDELYFYIFDSLINRLLFSGYYNDPQLTGTVMYDGYYHLGDLAYRDTDGYYWFVGRKDDIIKSSGYRIGPFEVESALMEHPAVLECAITGVPDTEGVRGQLVKATIVLAKGYEPSDELIKELQNHVKKTTAPYKYPRVVEFVTELPKTISGKIRRVTIREEDSTKF